MSGIREFMTKLNFKIGKQKIIHNKIVIVMSLYSPHGLELKYINTNYYIYKDTLAKVMIIKLNHQIRPLD